MKGMKKMGVFWHAAAFKKQDKVEIQEVLRELAAGRNEFEIELEACTVVECEAGDSQRCYELIGDFDAYYGAQCWNELLSFMSEAVSTGH